MLLLRNIRSLGALCLGITAGSATGIREAYDERNGRNGTQAAWQIVLSPSEKALPNQGVEQAPTKPPTAFCSSSKVAP